ncbi:hypothetical protein BGZ70_006497 [Mortierella alpina]|uniref:Striatin N-terminal domain-containing protein n=1 Tax=Mortierella alpina TaxID=64518 RepID=A0A9P6J7V8_MORAP|nr:hypothetical protein BGZ70_006497 [Mortierella alpina]
MHQFQPFAPQQMPAVAEYAFPSVLQFLQSEWRRFERDRNEWDIEKAEMKARIAFLEGEKRGVDNAKMDLMKRVKMLEYALRQERGKYLESKEGSAVHAQMSSTQAASSVTPTEGASGAMDIRTQNRMSTYSNPGQNMSQVSPTSTTPGLDLLGRAKSREFLRICLQEISYLTASVPQSIAMAAPPAPARLARNESDRRSAGLGARNRKSDFYPANVQAAPPPPLARASSVPVSTLQSLKGIKPTANSPPLVEPSVVGIAGPPVEDKAEDATLRQFGAAPSQHPRMSLSSQSRAMKDELISAKVTQAPTPSPVQEHVKATAAGSKVQKEAVDSDEGEAINDKDEDPITVVHSPMSGELWHAHLQKAGRELERPNGKKGDASAEDEAQLSKDVQTKFNISPERLNKMVKEWDKSKQEGLPGQKSMRKKKSKDFAILDELASLSVAEAEDTEIGSKESEAGIDEPARWRPKVTLKRHLDTVRSIAFHPDKKAILSGSEDGTMKYWNLESALKESKRPQVCEIDPIHTYRGHTKTITSVAISAELNKCFSASADSTIRSYKLVPMNKETYSRLDPTLPQTTFVGHTDAVWDIRLFPISISSSQLLGSISADGTLKIWDTETKGSPLRSSWGYHGQQSSPVVATAKAMPVPTALDFCPTDLKKVIVSYSNSVMKLFDIETGKEVLTFKSDETYDHTPATQINKVVCHPTLPLVVSGHEDRYIRFFDLNNGSCSYSMLSHLDAVSSLDIDPAGLVLCSGGHDSSVRLWDIASSTRACLQEFTGHRRKGDEGVCAVQYHPTMHGLMATGGADSIVKVYGRS